MRQYKETNWQHWVHKTQDEDKKQNKTHITQLRKQKKISTTTHLSGTREG